MKIRIVCDGTKHGCRVVNVETGEELQNVMDVQVSLSWKGAEATIRVMDVAVEIETEVQKSREVVYETVIA